MPRRPPEFWNATGGLRPQPGDLLRQEEDGEAVPEARVVQRDPRELRGRYHDDKVWGDAAVVKATAANPAAGTHLLITPPAELVRLTLRPPRLVTLQLIVTLKGSAWLTDTATWNVGMTLGLGMGRAAENMIVTATIAGPFPSGPLGGGFQFFWGPTGKITNPPLDPLTFSARSAYVTPFLRGSPTVNGGDYSARFFAAACPYYNHPEDEG